MLQPGVGLNLPLPDAAASTNLKTAFALAQGVHRAPGAEERHRGDGDQRDPADRRLLDLLRRRRRRASGEKAKTIVAWIEELVHIMLQDHRRRDVVRPGRGVRGDGRRRHDAGPRHPRDLREVHGRVLFRTGHPVGPPRVRGLRLPRRRRLQAARADQGAARARVQHRLERGRLPEDAGAAREVRRQQQDLELRAAAGLLVQPRRLDDVLHVRRAVHRAGLRHRTDGLPADHDAADPDGDEQGHGRRAARLAGGRSRRRSRRSISPRPDCC